MAQRCIAITVILFAISLSSISSTASTKSLSETVACGETVATWGAAASRDIECGDQSIALVAFSNSLNGNVGQFYAWSHAGHYGTFEVMREYNDGSHICRDFHGVSYRDGYRYADDGTVCKLDDGTWHVR
jgi:surface antigen